METNDRYSDNNASMSTPPVGRRRGCSSAASRGNGFRNINARRRGGDGLAQVRARPLQAASSSMPTGRAPSHPRTPARWGRPGATGTRSTCSGGSARRRPRGRHRPLRRRPHTLRHGAGRLPGRHRARCGSPGAAATRRRLRHGSPEAPRCTRTARSGRRRCGTCAWARSAAPKVRERWSPRACGIAPPEPSFLDMRNAILAAEVGPTGGGFRRRAVDRVRSVAAWASTPAR